MSVSIGSEDIFSPLTPAALTPAWLMCPPSGTLMVSTLSPGSVNAKKLAKFATTPDVGCTLA